MKRFFKIWIFLMLAFSIAAPMKSQEVSVHASLDSMAMPIGQQQTLRFEVSQPKPLNIQFPNFADTIIDKIEIVEAKLPDTVVHGERISIIQDYTITSFDSGFYYFEPFVFHVNPGADSAQVLSNPLVLKVLTYEIDTAKAMFDIKEPLELKYEFREIMPWLIGGLLLVVIVVAIIWLFRQLSRKEPIIPFMKAKPKEPAHLIALRDLETLKAEKLWQTDRVKLFYTRLTDILRSYIEGRYQLSAMEQTSDEILNDMKGVLTDQEAAMRNLKQILALADLVKFAKMKPLANENDLCMMNAILFVEQTRPVEVKSIEEMKKEMDEADADVTSEK